jgi:hypothetical protein
VQRFTLAVVSTGDKQPEGTAIVEETDLDAAEK